MIAMAEKAIASAIQAALSDFRSNMAAWVPQIFAQESAANQNAIQTWFSNAQNVVTVQVGYPTQQTAAPAVCITTEASQEVSGRQFVGSLGQSQAIGGPTSGTGSLVYATYWHSAFNCHVLGVNADWTLWMDVLVRWALLYERQNLQQVPPNGAGLNKQVISASGFRPAEGLNSTVYPYVRTVTLSAEHVDSWTNVAVSEATGETVTLQVSN